ncbi:MAG: DNA polymerase III subunit gamma/tau [Alistipes sp.]|nr:DNA polymerase III subunit gamma/tau [Alistipes sp.]
MASGFSLSELISGNAPETAAAADDQAPRPTAAATIDPRSAEKLEAARPRILALVRESRPRFVAAFEPMKFRGHAILIAVASEALREEILRNRTELLLRIAESAGIEGMLELEVTVSEEIRAARPIKLEDRVRHMTEKNPLLVELRRALDLETE